MALLLTNIELDNGLTVSESYVRIFTFNGTKENVAICVDYYLNNQSYLNKKSAVSGKVFSFIPSVEVGSPNFIKQGYEYLKTLPEFSTAIDA